MVNKTEKYIQWESHLDPCEICRKAIRGRFAGLTPEQMLPRCCVIGQPLYKAFVEESREIWGNDE